MKLPAPLELANRRPGDLKPWPDNPRTHSDKQLAKLKASIEKFGFTPPVVVDEAGVILSGHARTAAARELDLPEIPTRVIPGLTPSMKRALVATPSMGRRHSNLERRGAIPRQSSPAPSV